MGSQPSFYAYIALGSNMGDRERYLLDAIDQLDDHEEIRVIACSSIYETEPVGYVDQDSFLNMAAEVDTTLTPEALLDVMMGIERTLGRQRDVRWGPRTVDLDMLLYEDVRQDDPKLILPHPRMLERAFVLVPLVEVMQLRRFQQAAELADHLEKLEGKEGVILWKKMQ
ncbi:2-amino-4-hydroxy-6-hydroxymethyldihydropteridine diphosphokinase [Paenibacillus doosanensis]|uniref:2-amino-4-hydroxy-6-hydroxymethyldihydropteridine diphosphokinase n=1 Tax=Paenibacillus konkukensis TaxID=2020716 RepID=A0ABY4RRZ7_9BACL|nr:MULTISPECIES: 2-amino-4-hydroxy-6-hydroxymethyldihydropteridine diphosphokinase [Paenibacillus]MCS7463174.1 2-amino-4-hydroxy-6-hydroxymethyldihydropteridine diphosphokinase [Paenibacillus doosanensis]UQZ84938.1 Bifunctional folate synthesis protein [Paenibacillus konkukensis]